MWNCGYFLEAVCTSADLANTKRFVCSFFLPALSDEQHLSMKPGLRAGQVRGCSLGIEVKKPMYSISEKQRDRKHMLIVGSSEVGKCLVGANCKQGSPVALIWPCHFISIKITWNLSEHYCNVNYPETTSLLSPMTFEVPSVNVYKYVRTVACLVCHHILWPHVLCLFVRIRYDWPLIPHITSVSDLFCLRLLLM